MAFLNYRNLPCDHKLKLSRGPIAALIIPTTRSDEVTTTTISQGEDPSQRRVESNGTGIILVFHRSKSGIEQNDTNEHALKYLTKR